MKFLLKFIARCIFMIVSVPVLVITAIMESMYPEPDWKFWKEQNAGLILLLPWSSYEVMNDNSKDM